MTLLCYVAAVVLPNVGDVIAITGATVNPFIGFIFPILFYLKIDPSPMSSAGKRLGIFVILVTIIVSILGILQIATTWESNHSSTTTTK
jgi:amino acid permease